MKLGRNEKCHCGSDIKYKDCCLSSDLLDSNIKIEKSLEKENIYLSKIINRNNTAKFDTAKFVRQKNPIRFF